MINKSDKTQLIFLRDGAIPVKPGRSSIDIPLWKCRELLRTSYFYPCDVTAKKLEFQYNHFDQVEGFLKGERCFIIASGSSVDKEDLSLLDNEFTIAVNHSIIKYPKAKSMLFIDRDFIKRRRKIVESYDGLIFAPFRSGIHDVIKRDGIFVFPFNHGKPQKRICDGLYNATLAGMCALNLALIMGASKIYLLGYDLNISEEDTHCDIDDNVPIGKYMNRKWLDTRLKMFDKFKEYKSRIINCSIDSAIETFDKKPFKDVI